MEKLLELWLASGIYNLQFGQLVMMAVGLGLLYLAINKNFEPLLLVPIGFGGILANIPEAGLAFSAVENALYFAEPQTMANLAQALGIDSTDPSALKEAYASAGATAPQRSLQCRAGWRLQQRYVVQLLFRSYCLWCCTAGDLYGCRCYD